MKTELKDREKALEEVAAKLSTEVYKSTKLFEALETACLVHGNGHHMRQKIAEFAVKLLRERWNDGPATLYNRVMGSFIDFTKGRFILRQWDGMDGCWSDCHEAEDVDGEIALLAWMERTEQGSKRVSFHEIDYYRIFPANTRMEWDGSEGREMFRGGEEQGYDDDGSSDGRRDG